MNDTNSLKHIISANVKRLRAEQEFSQEGLALECDLCTRTIYNIEHEVSMPTIHTIIMLTKALNVSAEDIITRRYVRNLYRE